MPALPAAGSCVRRACARGAADPAAGPARARPGDRRARPRPPASGGPGQPAASALESVLPRRCGVCHLDKAPAGAAGLIAFKPPGSQAGAGDAGICYSCHNGIVSDDRRTLWSGRHHPASGKVTCGSCHTPHVQAPNVRPFMRYPQGSYAFCTSCHPGRRAGDAGEHPAVAAEKGRAQDCGGCHVVHRAQGDGLIRAASAESLCGPCHGENPSRAGRGPGMTTHVTGKSGPPCLGCHGVHKTVGGKMLLDKAALDGRLCRQCHERNFSSGKAEANHPVAPDQATCLSCHRMHNAEKPGARRGLLAAAVGGARHDLPPLPCRRRGPGQGRGVESSPGRERRRGRRASWGRGWCESGAFFAPGGRITCLSCHRSHAGRVGTPQLVTTREALCLYCHPAQNSLDPESAALGAHPISVKPRRARVDASFIKAGGRTGPRRRAHLRDLSPRPPGAAPATPGLVIPRESYSCLLCHTREASIASTPHSTARAPQAAKGAAAVGGLCGGCHGEHGWRVPLGEAAEGQTAIERLCAACHGAGAAGARFGGVTNHPLGMRAAPRPGDGGPAAVLERRAALPPGGDHLRHLPRRPSRRAGRALSARERRRRRERPVLRVPRRRGRGRRHPARPGEDPGDDVRALPQRARPAGGRELAGGARRGGPRRRRSRRTSAAPATGRGAPRPAPWSPSAFTRRPRRRAPRGQRRRLRRLPRPAPLEPGRCRRPRRARGG